VTEDKYVENLQSPGLLRNITVIYIELRGCLVLETNF
jgi:hypothetical protein